jgi:hypothetical protein
MSSHVMSDAAERAAQAAFYAAAGNRPSAWEDIREWEREGWRGAVRAAGVAEREAAVSDLAELAAKFSGTSEGDIFARVVLEQARVALRRGQAQRAGMCGKEQDCGGGCSLPVGHAPPCECEIGGDCPA